MWAIGTQFFNVVSTAVLTESAGQGHQAERVAAMWRACCRTGYSPCGNGCRRSHRAHDISALHRLCGGAPSVPGGPGHLGGLCAHVQRLCNRRVLLGRSRSTRPNRESCPWEIRYRPQGMWNISSRKAFEGFHSRRVRPLSDSPLFTIWPGIASSMLSRPQISPSSCILPVPPARTLIKRRPLRFLSHWRISICLLPQPSWRFRRFWFAILICESSSSREGWDGCRTSPSASSISGLAREALYPGGRKRGSQARDSD